MTHDKMKEMFRYIATTWPGKADAWLTKPEIMAAWETALLEYEDAVVSNAMHALVRDPQRDQAWPPSLAEIIQASEKMRKFLRSQGYKVQ